MVEKKEKKVHEELRDSAHKIWLAGLGALATAEEEGSKVFKKLVEKGEKFESKGRGSFEKAGKKARKSVESTWDQVEDAIDDKITSALRKVGVPTRREINELSKRVQELNAKLERMKPGTRAKAPAQKKT